MADPAPQSDPSLYVPQTQDPALTAIIQSLIRAKNATVSGAQSLYNQATTPHPFYVPTTPDPTVFGDGSGDPAGAVTVAPLPTTTTGPGTDRNRRLPPRPQRQGRRRRSLRR